VSARVARLLSGFVVALGLAVLASAPALALDIEKVVSPGGITAWLVEDHSVPIVSMSVAFRGGSALDSDDKAGLASFTADLLDEGAGDLDSTAYQSKLDDLAASIDFGADQDAMTAGLHTLSAHVASAFDLLRLALTAPRFDPAPVARLRAEILDSLGRDLRQPTAIAYRMWEKHAFAGTPYARSRRGTPQSIEHITQDDMRALVHARFAKDVLVIGVVGDITPAALKPLLDSTFGGLPAHAASDTLGDIKVHRSNEVLVSELGVPQSVVIFGQQGLKRDDPDWYAASLVLNILSSGGLTSRMALEVREQRGLAYSISANLEPLRHGGIIIGQVASRNARVAQTIALIRQQWRQMHDSGPTAKELADAKTYLTGSFPLNLSSTGRIASILVSIQLDHLGLDYLDRRDKLIDGVTLADAKRVAKRILDPDGLFFVVAGSPEDLTAARRLAPGG
jgi:zinc protease